MAFSGSWDETSPDGATTQADTIDDIIRGLKLALRERLEDLIPDWADDGVDPKVFAEGSARITVDLAANKPATPDSEGLVYFETDTGDLYIAEDDGGLQWKIYLGVKHQARASLSSSQSVPDSTGTVLSWGVSDYDIGDLLDVGGSNPSRITIQRDGIYLIGVVVNWGGTVSGDRWIGLRKNGGTSGDVANRTEGGRVVPYPAILVTSHCMYMQVVIESVASDYFQLETWQDSGGSLNVSGEATHIFIQEL